MTPAPYTPGAALAAYSRMKTDRDNYLERARKCALLTIPSLVPSQDDQEDKDRTDPYPYQALGARGVNNLASKLLLTLFPPNSPFFRFMLSDKIEEEMAAQAGADSADQLRLEFEKALQKAEGVVQKDFEATAIRPSLFEFFKHLIVTGNVSIADYGDDGFRVFGLHQFVIKRSPQGSVLEAVIREKVSPMSLPEGFLGEQATPELKDIDLYTHIRWNGQRWDVYQEVATQQVPGSVGTYTKDTMPFIFARMVKVDGADYGRSYVEEHYGDLYSLEQDSQSLTEITQIAARLLILVNPNGQTDDTDLQEAANGDIIEGLPEDIHMLQATNRAQIDAVRSRIADLKHDIAQSFLMNSSVQRNAERVTAEEIRFMASELEEALGGVYTILSQEVMAPLVNTRIASLKKRKALILPKDQVDLKVVVGVEALGRGHDLNRLRGWMQDVAQAAQVFPNITGMIKEVEILERLTASHGLTNVDLIITEQEAREAQAQQQQDELVKSVAPGVAQEVTKGAMQNGQQQ